MFSRTHRIFKFAPLPQAILLASLSAFSFSAFFASAASAQSEQAQPLASNRYEYNIPAGSLDQVLNRVATAAGIHLAIDGELTSNLSSKGLQGSYTVEAAFAEILSVSGLLARRQNDGSFTLQKIGDDNALTLPPVKIRADGIDESAYGPVAGYVAQRSATGTKTDTPIIETPQSISVVSRTKMDDLAVRDVGEAVAYSAGVVTASTGETTLFGGNNIRIRGHGGNGTSGPSFNEYVDGLKLHSAAYVSSNLDPWLFERVEVFKGPASVLFGQTQPGGIVNMVSKRPHEAMTNKLRLGTGDLEKASVALDLGGQINSAWQYRLLGLGLDGETQQDHSDRKRQLLAPSLRWSNGKTDLTLLAHYQHDDINATVLNVIHSDGVLSNPNGRVPLSFRVGEPNVEFWDRKTLSAGYLFSHRFNDSVSFRQNLRFVNNKQDSRWVYRRSLEDDRRTLNRRVFVAGEDADNLSIDNQLQWQFSSGNVKHTLLAGIDYQNFDDSTFANTALAPAIDLFTPVYNQPIPEADIAWWDDASDRKQLGIYLQDQIKIGALSMLLGARYDDAETVVEDLLGMSTNKDSDDDITGRVGIIYNFSNGFAPYASYSESFEPVTGTTFDGSRFEPTRGSQLEMGIKYQPADESMLVTVSVFDLVQENLTTADPVNDGFRVQTGEVQTKGIEFEGIFTINGNLDITLAYTHLDDEITSSNNGDEGNQRQQIPEQSASLWANYSFGHGALSGLGLSMGARYTGETEGDRGNSFSVPSYTLVDLSMRYDLGQSPLALQGWQAAFNINNLFDKYYIASCFRSNTCYLGLERTVRASLEYSW